MLDPLLVREAFRARLLALVVATTGSATLEATATGFTRASGSFLTEGFADGMELVGTGFNAANNATGTGKLISATTATGPVTATFLPIAGGLTVQAAAGARTLTVGLPQDRRWQGTQTPSTTAPATRPYIIEGRASGEFRLVSFPAAGGDTTETGLYLPTWYGLGNKGILAMERQIHAIKLKFTPGTVLLVGTSNAVRILSGPTDNGLISSDNGYLWSQVTIPWRGASINAIAA